MSKLFLEYDKQIILMKEVNKMKMNVFKRISMLAILAILSVGIIALTVGCGEKKDNKIKVGVCPGPYGDMFREAVAPVLEKKGYSIEIVEFTDYVQPDTALEDKEINANMFQNPIYLKTFNENHGTHLSWLVEVPTAGMGIYSGKYKSLEEIPDGAEYAIPNDNTNILRSLRVLESAGYLKLDPNLDASAVTLDDIIDNPHNYKFTEVSAEVLTTVIDSTDAAIINGNYVLGAGLSLADAVYLETVPENYFNTITVRDEDKDSQLAKDLIAAVHSDEFRKVIEDKNKQYYTFGRPADYGK